MSDSGFCTECGFRVETFQGINACPQCGTKSVPCLDSDQITVSVNWHELHVLGVWAENWARERAHTPGVVYAILARLQEQHPEQPPLSLAGEIAQIRQAFGPDKVQHNIRGVEGYSPDMEVEA